MDTFMDYQTLLDFARFHEGGWYRVTKTITDEAQSLVKSKYGQMRWSLVAKHEKELEKSFVALVNQYINRPPEPHAIRDFIVGGETWNLVAWSIADLYRDGK